MLSLDRFVQIPWVQTYSNFVWLYTPYSKMAADADDLGRLARERGIEGHDSMFTCLQVVL